MMSKGSKLSELTGTEEDWTFINRDFIDRVVHFENRQGDKMEVSFGAYRFYLKGVQASPREFEKEHSLIYSQRRI